jgi:hypothetical protein
MVPLKATMDTQYVMKASSGSGCFTTVEVTSEHAFAAPIGKCCSDAFTVQGQPDHSRPFLLTGYSSLLLCLHKLTQPWLESVR